MRSGGVDLVNQVFDRDDAKFAELLLNYGIVTQGDALTVDLGVATLVDQLTNGLQVRLSVGDVGFDQLQHLLSGLRQLDKHTVIDLQKAQQLQDLAGLRSNVGNTTQADDKCNLGLSRNVKVTLRLGQATQTNLLALQLLVLLCVLLSTLEDDLAL